MKIAVTYDNNGQIFQHFGRTENFKIYEIEDNKVKSSEVIGSNGAGHGALAGVLAEQGVQVLICGGLGNGAMNALNEAGIEVLAGVSGPADEAIELFLNDGITSSGVNCDHHGEGHSCGHHEEGGCGGCHDEEGGCGGGCGGCGGCHGGAPAIIFEGKNAGKVVKTHYKGTFDDGTQFDSSYDRGEPLEFICGVGMMIAGYDKAVVDMEVGESVDIHLMPSEAYGERDPEAIFEVEIMKLPGAEELNVGDHVYLTNPYGQPFPVVVIAKDDVNITFDGNHEMAGKELNFHIELVEVAE